MSVVPQLPTLYEYYTTGGIAQGLSANQSYFTLNNRNITIYSGAMHYFRVPREYWRDRLRKMRACGLNTVETYVPWNLHEPNDGSFDFGVGGSDMEQFLDIVDFLNVAKEEDLLAIVRPGPYICSEWEFGGLPSWLLRDKNIKVRTSQPTFMQYVTRYFNILLPLLAALQFTKGGPVIAFQVENEYGSTAYKGHFTPDKVYLEQLRNLYITNGIDELLFTSDSPTLYGTLGTLPEYFLQTANFDDNPEGEFDKLKQLQKNKPTMAMEYWVGWFDHWSDQHHTVKKEKFSDVFERILKYPASVNMYMFHGGTNWGFLNGANIGDSSVDNRGYQPDTTSYDYDGILTEDGDYTEKYITTKQLIAKYNQVPTKLPLTPALVPKIQYPSIKVDAQLILGDLLKQVPHKFGYIKPVAMEMLPLNNNSGQSYGYIVYRREKLDIPANSVLKIGGRVCDTVMVLINDVLVSKPLTSKKDLYGFGYWRLQNSSLSFGNQSFKDVTLDLVVENWGRNNFGKLNQFIQHKGIWQDGVYLNDHEILDWQIVPLEFKKVWTNGLQNWQNVQNIFLGPSLYKSTLNLIELPHSDTYIDMSAWKKGIVIVNGFVLGRYASPLGPQQTLYLPAPLLRKGNNEIIVFEHFNGANELVFSDKPIFYTPPS